LSHSALQQAGIKPPPHSRLHVNIHWRHLGFVLPWVVRRALVTLLVLLPSLWVIKASVAWPRVANVIICIALVERIEAVGGIHACRPLCSVRQHISGRSACHGLPLFNGLGLVGGNPGLLHQGQAAGAAPMHWRTLTKICRSWRAACCLRRCLRGQSVWEVSILGLTGAVAVCLTLTARNAGVI